MAFSAPLAPPGGGAAEPVTILLAGSVGRISTWSNVLMADGRFRVVTMATDEQDLRSKLSNNPEVLLLEAVMLENREKLEALLTSLQCSVYVLIPADAGAEYANYIKGIASVKGAFLQEINLIEHTGRIYGDTLALRQRASVGVDAVWGRPAGGAGAPTALRIIAVWNQMGGVGKTTVSTNLAYESARRGFPTLLIGLGAPDDMPLVANLKPRPNITNWMQNPVPDGIRAAVQKLDQLDVIAGFPDVLSEAQAIDVPMDAPTSVVKLIRDAAHYCGYAVIIIDAPPSALASKAIAAANTLVMVSRPSLEGVMRTVEAYRTVVERLSGEHRISANRVSVVLNRVGGRLSADEWHRSASQILERPFPPVIAQIPESVAVGNAQDNRRLPILTVDEFARALKPLADTLLQMPSAASPLAAGGQSEKKTINIGPIKIKV